MADRFAILGQVLPGDAWIAPDDNEERLYRVPLLDERNAAVKLSEPESVAFPTQTVVSSITVCNQDASARDFYVRLRKYVFSTGVPDPLNDKQFLFYGTSVGPNRTQILSVALTLSPGDEISVGASLADKLSFTAMGIEVT